eukprot:TRINITY_DN3296_c1_g1_i1.p1 TRINITY_DN3296_c1_g1~~TRINITY_DN3296_c1_g1_i1.p1  ORF type:complete len:58 (-),score=6.33 TRINITY_DN3296_c1_g1_i1:171-344(-)
MGIDQNQQVQHETLFKSSQMLNDVNLVYLISETVIMKKIENAIPQSINLICRRIFNH